MYDVDSFGQPVNASVYYMDALCLEWVPPEELELAAGQLLQAVQLDLRSPAMTRRAMVAIVWEPDAELRFELLQDVYCAVNIWTEFDTEFRKILEEEIDRMPTVTREKLRGESMRALLSLPSYRKLHDREFLTPVRQKAHEEGIEVGREKGREEGLEEGREEAHLKNLLAVLQTHGIHLSVPMVKKLKKLRFNQLPPIELAMEAKSAADFAKRAGLSNGAQR